MFSTTAWRPAIRLLARYAKPSGQSWRGAAILLYRTTGRHFSCTRSLRSLVSTCILRMAGGPSRNDGDAPLGLIGAEDVTAVVPEAQHALFGQSHEDPRARV